MARKKTATMNDDGVITPEEPVVFQTMPLERMDTLSEMYPDLFPDTQKKREQWSLHIKLVAVIVVCLMFAGFVIYNYNSYVSLLSMAVSQRSQIDAELQRRANLVPNLVEAMGIYTVYENQLVSHLAEVRVELVNTASGGARGKPIRSMEDAISRLLAIVERYPDLKANTTFQTLMTQLAETEDRIVEQRAIYNQAAMAYNNRLKSIPGCFLRYPFRLKEIEYFKAETAVKELPMVKLDLARLQKLKSLTEVPGSDNEKDGSEAVGEIEGQTSQP